jgi:oxygen-independent coproporphyrinogen-3 oxidase
MTLAPVRKARAERLRPRSRAALHRDSTAQARRLAASNGVWLEDPGFGVYLHIPFCATRCHYCDFNTYEGQGALHSAYVDALTNHIAAARFGRGPASSVFFGGGTPTLLPARQLGGLLDAVRDRIGCDPDAEITVEANPETVDEAKFEALLDAGFNRFSVGLQSAVPQVLRGLGRTHAPETALNALRAARRAGVRNLNADVIYGSPWERAGDWLRTLDAVIEEGPDHISAYALTVEEATPLATLVASGRVADVDPDVQAERYLIANERFREAGYARYEISNWARPGAACRHNVLYWSGGNYAGFGAGAHGHLDGYRWWNLRLPRDFIAAATRRAPVEAGSEVLDRDARAGEALTLGLRLASGIDLAGFRRRFGAESLAQRSSCLAGLESLGVVERDAGWLRLSENSLLVASDIACRLL